MLAWKSPEGGEGGPGCGFGTPGTDSDENVVTQQLAPQRLEMSKYFTTLTPAVVVVARHS